ncbi:glycosyltransferase family 4 protein [soil metagenome]
MRIVLVSDCYPPRLGGIESQVAALSGQLRSAGHDVCVLTATPGPEQTGVLRMNGLPVGPPIKAWAAPAMRTVLQAADVVHIHLGVMAPFAQMAALVATSAAIPTVITWHSLVASSPMTPALRHRWRRWMDRGALPTAVSTVGACQLATALSVGRVDLVRNGIHIERWKGDPAPGGGGGVQVVSAMRFTPRKRPIGLIAMLSQVRGGLPLSQRPSLVICGDGPLLEPLRRVVASTSLREWVELPGRVSRAHLAATYRRSDLYVAPARHEAFGIAALEAAAAGLPVVASAGSGVEDMVQHGKGGLLAATDGDLVGQLTRAVREPGRIEAMADHQRAQPPTGYSWSNVTAATVAIDQRAIATA